MEIIHEKSQIIFYNDNILLYYIFYIVACGWMSVLCKSVESQPLSDVYIHDDAQVFNAAHGQPRKLVFGKFRQPREDKTH